MSVLFTSKQLDKAFYECSRMFPTQVTCISIEKQADAFNLLFVNESKEDITFYLKTKFTTDNVSVYEYFLKKIEPILIKKIQSNDIEYIYFLPKEKSRYLYFRRGAFIDMRNKDKSSIQTLSFKLNIVKNIIYAIENAEVKNYGIDALLKYCFYFKKQPMFFLNNGYRKQMATNLADELLRNNLIKKDQYEDIKTYFSQ